MLNESLDNEGNIKTPQFYVYLSDIVLRVDPKAEKKVIGDVLGQEAGVNLILQDLGIAVLGDLDLSPGLTANLPVKGDLMFTLWIRFYILNQSTYKYKEMIILKIVMLTQFKIYIYLNFNI